MFGFMIAFHEFGHFITAKLSGVKVNEFSIGMGPKIFSIPKGETQYSLRLFPIGGFVSLEGEEEESDDVKSFLHCKPWNRILILAAGGIMNILLGFIMILILTTGQEALGTRTVAAFSENSASEKYLMVNDTILAVNGEKAGCDYDIAYSLVRDDDGIVSMDILRDGEKIHFDHIVLDTYQVPNSPNQKSIVLDFQVYGKEPSFFGTIDYAFRWTGSMIKLVWRSLGDIINGKFTLNDLSGPIGVTEVISEVTSTFDIDRILMIVGLITVNLGVMNLLPLPALDGGRIFFVLIEILFGKPVNRKTEAIIHSVGMIVLLVFSALIAYNDIVKIIAGG